MEASVFYGLGPAFVQHPQKHTSALHPHKACICQKHFSHRLRMTAKTNSELDIFLTSTLSVGLVG